MNHFSYFVQGFGFTPPAVPTARALSASYKRDLPKVLETFNDSPEKASEARNIMFTNALMVLLPYAEFYLSGAIYAYERVWLNERRRYMNAIRDFKEDTKVLHKKIDKLCDYSLFYLVTAVRVREILRDSAIQPKKITDAHFENHNLGKFGMSAHIDFGNFFLKEIEQSEKLKVPEKARKRLEKVFELERTRNTTMHSFSIKRNEFEYIINTYWSERKAGTPTTVI